jgi:uncharacterized membrane protein
MRENNNPHLKENGKVKKNSQFEKIVKVSILIGICVVTGFIIYYSLTPEPGYVYFGVLQDGEELENYTIEAKLGEQFNFSVIVGNYMKRDYEFRVKILKGNNNTILYPGPSNGTLTYTFEDTTLINERTWVSNIVSVSFNNTGTNHIVIIELWEIKSEIEYFFNILWIRLNITLS